jgi:CHAT domain-containing protein
MNERERAQDKTLRAALAEANRRSFAAETAPFKDDKQIVEAKAQVEAARRAYEAWQNQLRAAYPQLALVNGPSRAPLTTDEAARLLQPNDALLEYVVADDDAYLFVLTNTAGGPVLRAYALGLTAQDAAREVAAFRKAVVPEKGGHLNIGYKPAAHRLFQRLAQPAQAQLAGKTNLLIVPDAELWELPFQALVGPDGRRHLIETATVSYAPSLAALSEMRALQNARRHAAQSNLLALGNPALSNATLAHATTRANDFSPLPDAETEVRQLGRLFGARGKVLTGAEATEAAWKAEAGGYRYLHFAAHGQFNNRNPMYSRLMLARRAGDAAEDDGLLEAWEVMNLRLDADLAVLSACDTGRGQVNRGEGIIGLSWAFFVGGAPTSIVSHWPVNSPNTAKLMAELYRQLNPPTGRAVSPTEAFQRAAKRLLANPNTNHPYYWAGFSIIGAGM